jgi:hypothetical protein
VPAAALAPVAPLPPDEPLVHAASVAAKQHVPARATKRGTLQLSLFSARMFIFYLMRAVCGTVTASRAQNSAHPGTAYLTRNFRERVEFP